jgi:hypothetical protein
MRKVAPGSPEGEVAAIGMLSDSADQTLFTPHPVIPEGPSMGPSRVSARQILCFLGQCSVKKRS